MLWESRFRHAALSSDDLERNTIIEALKMTNRVQKDAAELLGVSRRVLNYKVKIHNINHDRWRRKPEINNQDQVEINLLPEM